VAPKGLCILGAGPWAPHPSGAWQKYPYNQTYGIIRAKNG